MLAFHQSHCELFQRLGLLWDEEDRVVCWLQPKRAMFDLGLRRGGGRRSLPEGGGGRPNLRLLRPHGGAHKWSSETPPATHTHSPPPNGQPVFIERSGRVPQGQAAHHTSPRAAISRMRHGGVGTFASDRPWGERERGGCS